MIKAQALVALAHVYAGQDSKRGDDGSEAAALIAKHSAAASAAKMLDSVLHGDSMFGGAWWSLEEVVHSVASLSKSARTAELMAKASMASMLVEVRTDLGRTELGFGGEDGRQ